MNVATITMPKEKALAKLAAYRTSRYRSVDAEYRAAYAGYRALAKGTALIHVEDAIRQGGLDEGFRPRLAIARADAKEIRFAWGWNSTRAEFITHPRPNWRTAHAFGIDMGRVHSIGERWNTIEAFALVPMVPPDIRPRGALSRFHILWEVEAWAAKSRLARPPRDPYLLRHLGGALFAVIAAWDLTDLERAVMQGRAAR